MAINLGNITYNANDFETRYLKMSSSDGFHDKFREQEYTYYFPDDYSSLPGVQQDPHVPEDRLAADIFGDTSTNNNQSIENSIQQRLIDKINNVPLIPTSHGLTFIENNFGYKYASLFRDRSAPQNNGNRLVQKLQLLGVPVGTEIFLCVDVDGGLLEVINSITAPLKNLYKFTVIFNRATITDPASNTIPILSKKNKFKFNALNFNLTMKRNIINNNLNFAIEDPLAPPLCFNGYNEISDMTTSLTSSAVNDVLGATLMSKFGIKLTYTQPKKYSEKLVDGKKGLNPKELKASLIIIDNQNNKVRIMDAKLCEKGANHTGLIAAAKALFEKLRQGMIRVLKLWRGDSNGGTHALGKKCGDWLQAQRTLDPNLTIRRLIKVKKGNILSKSSWTYSEQEKLKQNLSRACVTHDRILKQYSITIGAPIVIFKNAGGGNQPAFYEIYLKKYLAVITPEQFENTRNEYIAVYNQYYNIKEGLETLRDEKKNELVQINTLIQQLSQSIMASVDEYSTKLNQNGSQFLIDEYENFDSLYKVILKQLYSVQAIINISKLEEIPKAFSPVRPPREVGVGPNTIDQNWLNNANTRKIFNTMLDEIKYIKDEIAKISKIKELVGKNIQLCRNIINKFTSQGTSIDITNCAILEWKITNKGTVAQRQKLLNENVGATYLKGILEAEEKLQSFARQQSLDLTILSNAANFFEQAKITFIRFLITFLELISSVNPQDFEIGTDAYNTLRQKTQERRLNVNLYLSYVITNITQCLKLIDPDPEDIIDDSGEQKTPMQGGGDDMDVDDYGEEKTPPGMYAPSSTYPSTPFSSTGESKGTPPKVSDRYVYFKKLTTLIEEIQNLTYIANRTGNQMIKSLIIQKQSELTDLSQQFYHPLNQSMQLISPLLNNQITIINDDMFILEIQSGLLFTPIPAKSELGIYMQKLSNSNEQALMQFINSFLPGTVDNNQPIQIDELLNNAKKQHNYNVCEELLLKPNVQGQYINTDSQPIVICVNEVDEYLSELSINNEDENIIYINNLTTSLQIEYSPVPETENEYANQILAFLKQTEAMFLNNQVARQNQMSPAQLQKLQVQNQLQILTSDFITLNNEIYKNFTNNFYQNLMNSNYLKFRSTVLNLFDHYNALLVAFGNLHSQIPNRLGPIGSNITNIINQITNYIQNINKMLMEFPSNLIQKVPNTFIQLARQAVHAQGGNKTKKRRRKRRKSISKNKKLLRKALSKLKKLHKKQKKNRGNKTKKNRRRKIKTRVKKASF